MDAAPPPAGGAKSALPRLAEATLGALRTRAELAGVELVIERERLLRRAALLVGGAVAGALLALNGFTLMLVGNVAERGAAPAQPFESDAHGHRH